MRCVRLRAVIYTNIIDTQRVMYQPRQRERAAEELERERERESKDRKQAFKIRRSDTQYTPVIQEQDEMDLPRVLLPILIMIII